MGLEDTTTDKDICDEKQFNGFFELSIIWELK